MAHEPNVVASASLRSCTGAANLEAQARSTIEDLPLDVATSFGALDKLGAVSRVREVSDI